MRAAQAVSDSVFDNLVERASREMNDFGHKSETISQDRPPDPARDLSGRHHATFERRRWQPTFYPSVGEQVSNESLILAQNQRWRRA